MERTLPRPDVTALVGRELDRVRQAMLEELAPDAPELQPLLEHVSALRGKQLRPALVMLAAKAVGEVEEAHYTVAAVVELIHLATLIHDDILDDATVRRQLATVNELHGYEISVLLGDYVYARAFHMSVSLGDPTCSRELSEVARVICQGEITQLLHRLDFDWTEERYLRVIADKTGSLFGAAARLGAHYAGAEPDVADALARYGLAVGTAFQIVDDCLDLQGDEGVVGKSLGSDLEKGKLTLPLLYLLRSSDDAPQRLRALMGSPRGIERLAGEFRLGEAVAFSLEKARGQVETALLALEPAPRGPARTALEGLARHVIEREL